MSKYNFPKIELHLHLDGSMNPKVAYPLAKEYGLISQDLPYEQFAQDMVVGEKPSLWEYLDCFKFPIAILQTEKALYETTYDLVKRLSEQNVVYAEIRYAPQYHRNKGLDYDQIQQAVINGAKKAMQDYPSIRVNIINCLMINTDGIDNDQANWDTLQSAYKYLNKGVCGIDLAGAEDFIPMEHFQKFFDKAYELNIPITCHGGESGSYKNVDTAIKFHATRIGHGVHATENKDTIQSLIDHDITLEVCPTSNVHCSNQPSYEKHALPILYKAGIKTTISTDNSTLSSLTLDDEYDHAINQMGLSEKDIIIMNKYAMQAAFTDEQYKQKVIAQLDKYLLD